MFPQVLKRGGSGGIQLINGARHVISNVLGKPSLKYPKRFLETMCTQDLISCQCLAVNFLPRAGVLTLFVSDVASKEKTKKVLIVYKFINNSN